MVWNRHKTHCNSDHEFTEANTKWAIGSNGKPRRICRECARLSCVAYYEDKVKPRRREAQL